MNNINLIYDINLIANIINFDTTLLYNMLCAIKYNKDDKEELLKNITVIYLDKNTK